MNISAQGELRSKLEIQIKTDLEVVEMYSNKMSELPNGSEEYSFYESNIKIAKSNTKTFKKIISYIDEKNWPKFYEAYSKELNYQKQMEDKASSMMNNDDTKISSIGVGSQLVYIRHLNENNLIYEERDFPIFGLTFMTSMMQIILPTLMTILCVYILSQVFTLDYSKGENISILLPIDKKKIVLSKLLVGIAFSLLVYSIILCSSFLLATLLSGNSGWNYPIVLLDKNTDSWIIITVLSLIKDWFFLGALFFVSITLFSYLLSIIVKEDVYLFFLVSCIILGLSYMPTIIDSMKSIAHVLPTTYMNCVNVTLGNLSTQYSNTEINTSTGTLVLTISIIIQSIMCFLYNVGTRIYNLKESQ
ncbi:hypothetical protein [Amedibacillus sp. YH-ame6]